MVYSVSLLIGYIGLLSLPALTAQATEVQSAAYTHKQTQKHMINGYTTEFSKDYMSARSRFRTYAAQIESQHPNSTTPLSAQLQSDSSLFIDGLYIKSTASSKLLIVTSGIHGPEAFTGSTLQDLFVQYLLKQQSLSHSVLLIHGLNPYGFHYFRRVNAQNVDLNRNHASRDEFSSINPSYEALSPLISTNTPASVGILPQIGFYLGVVGKYLLIGKRTILNSLSGQYKEPRGLFYGGTQQEPESLQVQQWILERSKDKTHIVHIDLHTGFGKRGQLHFYGSDEFNSPEQLKSLKVIFPKASIDTGTSPDFYPTHGDFIDWTWKSHADKVVVPMVFEFGTMDSDTIKGGVSSLWTLALENQGHHYGYVSRVDQRRIRRRMEALFNPQDMKWQSKVLTTGFTELVSAYEKIKLL